KHQLRIIKQLLKYTEVNWISELSSEDGLDINAQFFDRLSFRKFIQNKIIALPGVHSTRSHLILNSFGSRY
ncbi:MAG: hypothetical protein KAR20_23515, partial [Candidatus Heimdallarchaeota archaeon]|nr:hypothetical protein [Candidatus Heimdallarchaeota archaeon]